MALFVYAPSSAFEPPSLLFQFLYSPLQFVIRHIYHLTLLLRGPASHTRSRASRIRIICISDTHTHEPKSIPDGDVLIHAGDLTNTGTALEIQRQVDWLSSLPHPYKIAIAGNHDGYLDPRSRRASDQYQVIRWGDIQYLQHSSTKIVFPTKGYRRLSFYGAPQIPRCGGEEFAFQYRQHEDAWSGTIPAETDVLITHTPPRFHLDLPAGLGCGHLLKEVWRIRPKVHVFGHVHAGYGQEYVFWDKCQEAYERICARGNTGLFRDIVDVSVWTDVAKVLLHGGKGILWSRVWGGNGSGGVMVNAALAYRNTGKLGNSPTVIDV